MEHKIRIQPGKALVIVGPQGCGKSILARLVAEQYGSFVETDARELETHRGLDVLLAREPNTVICEGVPASEEAQIKLKALITSDEVKVVRKHGSPKMVSTPNFIFYTDEANPLPPTAEARRFYVVQLGVPE